MSESTVGAVYRQVADEHREAIELARRIVATPLEYGENRMALALVAIDEALTSSLRPEPRDFNYETSSS